MGNGSGLSRGDRNRNARLARLRELVPHGNAIVGIDLADDKQAEVVTDHDSRVIARRRVSARAWELGELLDWAVARACEAGFGSARCAMHSVRSRASRRLGAWLTSTPRTTVCSARDGSPPCRASCRSDRAGMPAGW